MSEGERVPVGGPPPSYRTAHLLLLTSILGVLGYGVWSSATRTCPGAYADWVRDRDAWDSLHVEEHREHARFWNDHLESMKTVARGANVADDLTVRLSEITAQVSKARARLRDAEAERDRLFPEPKLRRP